MKLSIITATLNSAKVLSENLESVRSQVGDFELEHIIRDGGSTDGTLQLLQTYQASADYSVKITSEKDQGFYDAVNLGIEQSSGDIIGILNSDDWLAHEGVVEELVSPFRESPKLDLVYGDLDFLKPVPCTNGSQAPTSFKVVRRWRSCLFEEGKLKRGWMPPHPTVYVRRRVYEEKGLYRLDMGTSGDYEWLLRVFLRNPGLNGFAEFRESSTVRYIPSTLIHMRIGGLSNRSLLNRIAANHMDRRSWKVNNLKPWPFLRLFKPLRKSGQWF